LGRGASHVPRILFLDIETKPAIIWSFGIRDQHITHKQIKEDGGVICVGLKWAGEKKVRVLSTWEHGFSEMIAETHKALSEADAVATYNGAAFDIPKLMGCFLLEGLKPPPPLTQIDIYKAVRKMGFISNKLDYIAPKMGLGGKVKHEGLELWLKVMDGDESAQKRMARYCAGDVRLTEQVYEKVRPYIPDHPHLGFISRTACPACGSHRTQRRGVRRTKAMFMERIQCIDCGAWHTGARSKVAQTLAAMA
jgi:uncharacterized protein YprB with RNaseH-like and TPR domain